MQLRSVLTIDGIEVQKCQVSKFNGIEVYEATVDNLGVKDLFFVNESTKEVLVKMEIKPDCRQNYECVPHVCFIPIKKG